MPRREEALAAMRDALQLQDPEWDITPGTAEYHILEALAQQIENITFNSVLNDYHFDVDKKSGLELDFFMSLFGFARIKAKRATGEVTFERGTAAVQDYTVQFGTQIFVPATTFVPSIFFQTTVSAVLPEGSTEVSVPVQAVVAGTFGNVGSGAVTGLATAVGGVTAVINAQPISGGRDAETDQDLRDRWKRSVFRNISGTEDQFLGLAFNESAFVTRANLVGPVERYREQVQLSAPDDLTVATPWETTVVGNKTATDTSFSVVNGDVFSSAPFWAAFYNSGEFQEIIYVGTKVVNALSDILRADPDGEGTYDPPNNVTIRQVFPSSTPDSAFTFSPGGEVVGLNINLSTQQVGRRGTDYEIVTDNTTPHAAGAVFPFLYVHIVGAQTFGLDEVVEMEHEYTPLSSRNDPGGTRSGTHFSAIPIADKVDMFVDGEDPLTATEQFPFRVDNIFGTNVTITDYLRDDGVNPPSSGNIFTQLSKTPVTEAPDSISVSAATTSDDATVYYKDEDYWLVRDVTVWEGAPRAEDGLEWRDPLSAADNAAYAAGTFAATVAVTTGKLAGWYSYIVTYEVDGVETLSITDTPETPSGANNVATAGRNNLVIPVYVPGPAHDVVWRKVYRTTGQASQLAAEAATHYLLTVIKNNVTVAYVDNKDDDALGTISPPKAAPAVDNVISLDYSYNRLIERLDAQVDLVRLVGMDTLVHAADEVQLKFNLAVVLVPGFNSTDVETDINTQLHAWLARKFFLNNVQIADMIDTVANSVGVDNVRLVEESEARNDTQKVTIEYPAAYNLDRDTFTFTIDGVTSGKIRMDDSIGTVREILEGMPNIHEGNTFATTLAAAIATTSVTSVLVDDNDSIHFDNDGTNIDSVVGHVDGYEKLYVQVDSEILLVTNNPDVADSATQTWTVKRGQLGTTAATHLITADVHIIGDIAVTRTGTAYTTPFVYTLYFLPNYYTGVNDWGFRYLDLITETKGSETSRIIGTVAKKVNGVGWGIQQIAFNDQTVIVTYTDDFYLDSDELPSLWGVDVLVKAQNTF